MKRSISILLVLMLLVLVAVPMAVSGEETEYDWDNMDWETFDWNLLAGTKIRSLSDWLTTSASISSLFVVEQHCTSAFYFDTLYEIMLDRFLAKPESFLIALAAENQDYQHRIINSLCFHMSYRASYDDCIHVLESIRLNGETNPEAVRLMLILIDEAKLRLGVSIIAPPTGDPVTLSVLGLVCSSAGMLLLKKRKRTD